MVVKLTDSGSKEADAVLGDAPEATKVHVKKSSFLELSDLSN